MNVTCTLGSPGRAVWLCILLFAGSFGAVNAEQPTASGGDLASGASGVLTTLFDANRQNAPIKTQEDLVRYRQRVDANEDPFMALKPGAEKAFVASLQFGTGGLASFNSAILERELTPTQSYAILALFGMQDAVLVMHHRNVESALDAELNSACKAGGGDGDVVCEP